MKSSSLKSKILHFAIKFASSLALKLAGSALIGVAL